MSTLHERLVAKVAEFTDDPPGCAADQPWFCGADDYELAVAAVRAVVELHAPIEHRVFGTLCGECSVLESGQGWDDVLRFVAEPCNTKRVIAEALGIGETPK